MAPHRLIAAFVVWLRDQMPQTEEGANQWKQLIAWWDAPLATPGTAPEAAIPPRGAPPGAPVTPEAQAAAAAAYMAAGG